MGIFISINKFMLVFVYLLHIFATDSNDTSHTVVDNNN